MRLARVLGVVGRGLISAGVIVLLFVAYQLWGTGLQANQAQDTLESDFTELLDSGLLAQVNLASQVDPDSTDVGDTPDAALASGDPAATDESETDDAIAAQVVSEVASTPEQLALVYPEEGESLARIVIPAINVHQIAVEGVSVEDLRKGPGHYPSTPNPGQAGNASIAGHRTTYGAPFHRVDELVPGDEIIVTTVQGVFTYRVRGNVAPDGTTKGHFIVSPSDTWVLGQESGENLLTLTACHPKYSARQRIIVQAELVGEPAVTPRGEEVDFAPVVLDAGASDERGQAELAEAGDVASDDIAGSSAETGAADDGATDDGATGADLAQVISDEVAADDDPSVDADGVPTTAETADTADAFDDAPDENPTEDVELTSNESPFDDDFGEGLNGDPTKLKPALLWALAGGSIWLAAWFIGRRLNRKWTMYAIGIVPFVPVLWSCFVNIDQALPSY